MFKASRSVRYAPYGEDEYLVTRFPEGFRGCAAEVGAWDGQQGSVTLALEQDGWKVLCVEPNPYCEESLKQWRDHFVMAAASDYDGVGTFNICSSGTNMPAYSALKPIIDHPVWHPGPNELWRAIEVRVARLDTLLEEAGFDHLDAATIDVEGGEMDVLKGFDLERWKPKVLVIEQWNEDNPIRPYLAERGYRFDERLYVNDCFIRL